MRLLFSTLLVAAVTAQADGYAPRHPTGPSPPGPIHAPQQAGYEPRHQTYDPKQQSVYDPQEDKSEKFELDVEYALKRLESKLAYMTNGLQATFSTMKSAMVSLHMRLDDMANGDDDDNGDGNGNGNGTPSPSPGTPSPSPGTPSPSPGGGDGGDDDDDNNDGVCCSLEGLIESIDLGEEEECFADDDRPLGDCCDCDQLCDSGACSKDCLVFTEDLTQAGQRQTIGGAPTPHVCVNETRRALPAGNECHCNSECESGICAGGPSLREYDRVCVEPLAAGDQCGGTLDVECPTGHSCEACETYSLSLTNLARGNPTCVVNTMVDSAAYGENCDCDYECQDGLVCAGGVLPIDSVQRTCLHEIGSGLRGEMCSLDNECDSGLCSDTCNFNGNTVVGSFCREPEDSLSDGEFCSCDEECNNDCIVTNGIGICGTP